MLHLPKCACTIDIARALQSNLFNRHFLFVRTGVRVLQISYSKSLMLMSNDARHEKTDLKVLVVVIPKEGWVRVAAPILLLV